MYKIFNESEGFEDELKSLENIMGTIETIEDWDQETVEASAKGIFEKLTHLYQIALLQEALDQENEAWILPSIQYLKGRKKQDHLITPLSVAQIKAMMGWSF